VDFGQIQAAQIKHGQIQLAILIDKMTDWINRERSYTESRLTSSRARQEILQYMPACHGKDLTP
jgi:hypothetical protein